MSFFRFYFICCFSIFFSSSKAQDFNYILTEKLTGYAPLINGLSIATQNAWVGNKVGMKLPFQFNCAGAISDSLTVEITGLVSFISDVGQSFLAFNSVSYPAQSAANLAPAISILEEGVEGSRIFKMEFKCVIPQVSPSNCFNYQLWLYESSNRMEFYMGANTYAIVMAEPFHPEKNSPSFPGYINQKINNAFLEHSNNSHASFPTGMLLSSGNNDLFYINHIADIGTVYTFTPLF